MKVRVAGSRNLMTSFTRRGPKRGYYTKGFIKLEGKTVTGLVYDGGAEQTFYPSQGVNYVMCYSAATANLRAARDAARQEAA